MGSSNTETNTPDEHIQFDPQMQENQGIVFQIVGDGEKSIDYTYMETDHDSVQGALSIVQQVVQNAKASDDQAGKVVGQALEALRSITPAAVGEQKTGLDQTSILIIGALGFGLILLMVVKK